MRRMRWLANAALAVVLTGCLPLPIPYPGDSPPFEGRLDFIQVGRTTRADVITRLGVPGFVGRQEHFFGYVGSAAHPAACFPVFVGYGVAAACIDKDKKFGGETIHFVGIEFDDRNVVTRVDAATAETVSGGSWRVCLASGICLDQPERSVYAPDQPPGYQLTGVVLAPTSEDAEAKRFQAVPDRCIVYVVRSVSKDYPNWLAPIRLDAALAGGSAHNTYFLFTVAPGPHKIETTLPEDIKSYQGPGGTVQFTCGPGDRVYVRQDGLGRLVIVPESAGKAEVLRAEKILDNF